MIVKCPRCSVKGEIVNGKCQVCDYTFGNHTSKPFNKKIYIPAVVAILLIIISCLAYQLWSKNTLLKSEQEQIKKRQSEASVKEVIVKVDPRQYLSQINQPKVSNIQAPEEPVVVGRTLCPSESFYEGLSDDYNKLPKIQIDRKYKGTRLVSSNKEKITYLEYLPHKNVSRMVLLAYTKEKWHDATIYGRGGRITYVKTPVYPFSRFSIVFDFPGKDMALTYKKEDLFPINGVIRNVNKSANNYTIYCDPI